MFTFVMARVQNGNSSVSEGGLTDAEPDLLPQGPLVALPYQFQSTLYIGTSLELLNNVGVNIKYVVNEFDS